MGQGVAQVAVQNRNNLQVNYDFEKIFLFNNNYISVQYTNPSATEVATLNAGLVVGRVSASRLILPLVGTATDGSQYVLGILASTVQVAPSATLTVNVCIEGDVNEAAVTFAGAQTYDTVVSGRVLRDKIAAETAGIRLTGTIENTAFDN